MRSQCIIIQDAEPPLQKCEQVEMCVSCLQAARESRHCNSSVYTLNQAGTQLSDAARENQLCSRSSIYKSIQHIQTRQLAGLATSMSRNSRKYKKLQISDRGN